MVDSNEAAMPGQYEFELTGGRDDIADILTGVVDGIRTGTVQLGRGDDAVSVDVPDDLALDIELEDDGDELSLELELDWPAPDHDITVPTGDRAGETPTLAGVDDAAESLAQFEIYRDQGEEWRWRLRHRNGNIIAISGQGYTQKHNAEKGLRSVVTNSPEAAKTEPSTD